MRNPICPDHTVKDCHGFALNPYDWVWIILNGKIIGAGQFIRGEIICGGVIIDDDNAIYFPAQLPPTEIIEYKSNHQQGKR